MRYHKIAAGHRVSATISWPNRGRRASSHMPKSGEKWLFPLLYMYYLQCSSYLSTCSINFYHVPCQLLGKRMSQYSYNIMEIVTAISSRWCPLYEAVASQTRHIPSMSLYVLPPYNRVLHTTTHACVLLDRVVLYKPFPISALRGCAFVSTT